MIPAKIKNARLKHALLIPTNAPITVANDAIEMLPVVTDKISLLLINSLFFNLSNKIIFNFIDFA